MHEQQPSKIWFDATTVFQFRKHSPVGLTRVEAYSLRAALDNATCEVGFCTFDRYQNSIQEVSHSEVRSVVDGYGTGPVQKKKRPRSGKRWFGEVGRNLERVLRCSSRRAIAKTKAFALGNKTGLPNWKPGDVYVISGGTWDSVNEDVLHRIVNQQKLRLAVVVCDMIPDLFPHHFQSATTVQAFERLFTFIAKHSSLTLHISQSTQRDFKHFASRHGIFPQSSEVLILGSDTVPNFDTARVEIPEQLKNSEYILCVGSIQVRKNHQLLYQLWRRFAELGIVDIPKLVLAGSPGFMTGDLMQQIQRDPLVQDSIVILNHVNDPQLHWLYANCLFTVYPSLYEGWGLPIVESLQYGKPCMSSSTSSMPEAGQGLSLLIDPLDFTSWFKSILSWHQDRHVLSKIADRIQQQFRSRTWQDYGTELMGHLATLASRQSTMECDDSDPSKSASQAA